MGVQNGFTTFYEQLPNPNLFDSWQHKSELHSEVVVEIYSLLYHIYERNEKKIMESLTMGDYQLLEEELERWIKNFRDCGRKLVAVIAEGTAPNTVDIKMKKAPERLSDNIDFANKMENKELEPWNPGWLAAIVAEKVFRRHECKWLVSQNCDADMVMVEYAKLHNAEAILSKDSDFLIFNLHTTKYIWLDSVCFDTESNEINFKYTTTSHVITTLGLKNPRDLVILASSLGCDVKPTLQIRGRQNKFDFISETLNSIRSGNGLEPQIEVDDFYACKGVDLQEPYLPRAELVRIAVKRDGFLWIHPQTVNPKRLSPGDQTLPLRLAVMKREGVKLDGVTVRSIEYNHKKARMYFYEVHAELSKVTAAPIPKTSIPKLLEQLFNLLENNIPERHRKVAVAQLKYRYMIDNPSYNLSQIPSVDDYHWLSVIMAALRIFWWNQDALDPSEVIHGPLFLYLCRAHEFKIFSPEAPWVKFKFQKKYIRSTRTRNRNSRMDKKFPKFRRKNPRKTFRRKKNTISRRNSRMGENKEEEFFRSYLHKTNGLLSTKY